MKKNIPVIISVLIASILISGSLIFLGVQMAKTNSSGITQADINKGIDNYIKDQQTPPKITGDLSDDDAFLGDEDAEITLVEFSDFQCPYCRQFYNETLPLIKTNFIDTGKVKFVYRDFPLSFHDGAYPSALASECARDQKGDEMYFKMHDKIFDGQNKLGSGTVSIEVSDLITYAEELKLDMDEFNECYNEDKFQSEISNDLQVGQSIGISGTPGFVLDGNVISGAQPYNVFESALNEALNN